jgi:hypothetical protein
MHKAPPAMRTILMAARLILAGAASLQALELPDLTGTWKLNKDMSDDPATVWKEAREPSDSTRGGSTGGGLGMGHGRGHGMARGGGARHGDDGAGGLDFFAALQTLRIEHHEPALSITDGSGRARMIYTDGRKTEEERSHGGTTKVTARWKDGRIEATSVPERGPKVTEKYAITADRLQLTVTTTFEGGHGSDVTIRRIYDAVRDAAPQSAPTPPPASQPPDEFEPMVTACAP